jgi:chromosome segregation ATPase
MPKDNESDKIKKDIEMKESKASDPPAASGPGVEMKADKPEDKIPDPGKSPSSHQEAKKQETLLGTKLGEMAERIGGMAGTGPGSGATAQASAQTPAAQASSDNMKREISNMVKKKVESKLSEIKESTKGLEKISSLESKLNQITEKLGSQVFQPPPQASPVAGRGGSISRELASFGEEVDFQTELYEVKRTLAGLAKSLDTLSKKMEYRISVLEDRSKALERIPDLEDKFSDIRQKLGPENVQKLRKLIFSSDEIVDEVIPDLVSKKMRAKLDPAMNEIRDMQETINDFNSRLSHIKEEVLNLEKLRDDIQELRVDKENLYKDLDEEESRANERLDILKQNVRRKIEHVVDKFSQELRELRGSQADSIKNEVKNTFLNLSEPRFSDLEKNQMLTEERLKRMSHMDSELDKKIASIEAPENLKKWLDTRVAKLESGVISDIRSLKRAGVANASKAAALAEDLKSFHAAMKEVPRRLDTQGNMINKLLDTKDYFAGRAEGLTVEFKGLSERLSSLKAGLAGLEQRLAGQESRLSDSLNRQRDYLTSAKEDLSKHLEGEIASIRKTLERKSQEQAKTSLAEFKADFKRLSGTEEELKMLRKTLDTSTSRLQKEVADLQAGLQGARPELKLLSGRLEELESAYKELSEGLTEASDYHKTADSVIKAELLKYFDAGMKAFRKEMETRRSEDAKSQLREFKDELKRLETLSQELSAFRESQEKRTDDLSRSMSSLSGPLADLKNLSVRTGELEDIGMAMDKRLDAVEGRGAGQISSMANRLNLIEKGLGDVMASHDKLEKRVSEDNEQLQGALGQVVSDRKALEGELAAQRASIGRLIKELKSA